MGNGKSLYCCGERHGSLLLHFHLPLFSFLFSFFFFFFFRIKPSQLNKKDPKRSRYRNSRDTEFHCYNYKLNSLLSIHFHSWILLHSEEQKKRSNIPKYPRFSPPGITTINQNTSTKMMRKTWVFWLGFNKIQKSKKERKWKRKKMGFLLVVERIWATGNSSFALFKSSISFVETERSSIEVFLKQVSFALVVFHALALCHLSHPISW